MVLLNCVNLIVVKQHSRLETTAYVPSSVTWMLGWHWLHPASCQATLLPVSCIEGPQATLSPLQPDISLFNFCYAAERKQRGARRSIVVAAATATACKTPTGAIHQVIFCLWFYSNADSVQLTSQYVPFHKRGSGQPSLSKLLGGNADTAKCSACATDQKTRATGRPE